MRSKRLVRKYSGSMLEKLRGRRIEREYSNASGGSRRETLMSNERAVPGYQIPDFDTPC